MKLVLSIAAGIVLAVIALSFLVSVQATVKVDTPAEPEMSRQEHYYGSP